MAGSTSAGRFSETSPDGRRAEDTAAWDGGTARLGRWDALNEFLWYEQRVGCHANGSVDLDLIEFSNGSSCAWRDLRGPGRPLGGDSLFAFASWGIFDDHMHDHDRRF